MNKILVAFVFAVLNLSAFAQINIFSENIGSTPVAAVTPVASYTGFQNYGIANYSGSADVRTTTPSTGSAGNNVFLSASGSTTFTVSNIDISGATAMQLSFLLHKSTTAENGASLVVSIVVDGGTPVTFSPALPTGAGTAVWHTIAAGVSIPTGLKMSITFTNSSTTNAFRIDDILITSQTPLPVSFGGLIAAQKSGVLQISWQTFTETNNDHFEVEVSNNGRDFTKLASIQSKALNGNSNMPLQYEYIVPVKQVIAVFIPILLAFLSLGVKKYRQKISLFASAFVITIITLSCHKENIADNKNIEKMFVRIAQVDADGAKVYSKIVQVVRE